jgi:selenocysteine lyase/cysteine desulfurase
VTAAAEAFRARFPMLARTTYLASCSLGARSTDLDDALARMLEAMRDGGWEHFEHEVERSRERFAALTGTRPEQIAVLPNASIGAHQAASSLSFRRRPLLRCSDQEFPSLSHVWLGQRARGAEVRHTPDPAGAVDERTALVSLPLVTYRDGVRQPVAEAVAAAHAAGARVFVDAYQALGTEPVDVTALGCDFLVAGSGKYLLGLPGVAFLYVRAPADAEALPSLTGWFGRKDPFAFDPLRVDFPDTARRYETGTPSVPSCYAAGAGLGLVAGTDLDRVRAHIAELTALTTRTLRAQGEQVRAPHDPDARGAHVAVAEPDAHGLAHWLAARRIVTSPRGDVLRLSFHYYNNAEDVEAVCEAMRSYRCKP